MFLIDANVLIDVATTDSEWRGWSEQTLREAGDSGRLFINPIVYAELARAYRHADVLDAVMARNRIERLPLPYPAAFLAGEAHQAYRRAGGQRTRVLADFLIGAHAAVAHLTLLTRDPRPYRTYFPEVALIAPQ